MKRTIIIAAAALLLGIGVQAQDKQKDSRRPDEATMIQGRTQMMVKQLGLDENQAKQLLELNKEYSGKMGPMMGHRPGMGKPDARRDTTRRGGPGSGMSKEKMEGFKANREAYEAKLKTILTDEQFKKYQELQQAKGPQGRRSSRGRQGGRPRS